MAYWVKKDVLTFPKYFNSLDMRTRIISRVIAFIILFIIILILKSYFFRLNYLDTLTYDTYYIARTKEDLIIHFPMICLESFIYALSIFLFVHFLDHFTKDKRPPLICNTCFKRKEFDNYFKCECGGKYVKESEYECYESEKEFISLRPYSKLKGKKTKSDSKS